MLMFFIINLIANDRSGLLSISTARWDVHPPC
jgi:hypothetical protein